MACGKRLLTQIPRCLVLLFVSRIIRIFLSAMHFFHRPSRSNVLASICGSPCGVKVPADDWATGVDGTRSGMGLTCEEPNSCDTETKNHLASDAKPNTETSDIAQVARSQGSPKC